ncbi:hypothetical protein SM139_1585, partial [Stenotrophomonas maltophilia]
PSVAWPLPPRGWAWPLRTCSRGCHCPVSSASLAATPVAWSMATTRPGR